MGRINVPTTYAEAKSFRPIDPGIYKAEIIDVHAKISKAGNAYLAWTLSVTEGPSVNRRLWYNTPYEGNAIGFLKDLAEAIGESWGDGWSINPDTDDAGEFDTWVERTLTVVVDVETRPNGSLGNSVKPVRM